MYLTDHLPHILNSRNAHVTQVQNATKIHYWWFSQEAIEEEKYIWLQFIPKSPYIEDNTRFCFMI